jgi:hypothetical protein
MELTVQVPNDLARSLNESGGDLIAAESNKLPSLAGNAGSTS